MATSGMLGLLGIVTSAGRASGCFMVILALLTSPFSNFVREMGARPGSVAATDPGE